MEKTIIHRYMMILLMAFTFNVSYAKLCVGFAQEGCTELKTTVFKDGVIENIRTHTEIQSLDLSENLTLNKPDYAVEFAEILSEILNTSPHITHLKLSGNFFTEESLKILARALIQNTTLLSLDCSECELPLDYSYFAAGIMNSSTQKLNLESSLRTDAQRNLALALLHPQVKSSITQIDLSNNGLDDVNAHDLADFLLRNNQITHLDIGFNAFTNEGVTRIVESITNNDQSKVESLNMAKIGGDFLNEETAQAIAKLLLSNVPLKELDLTYNNIGVYSKPIFDALKTNTTLTTLILDKNPELDYAALTEALKNNTTLRSLSLAAIEPMVKNIQQLAQLIKHNTGITDLNLSRNDFDDTTMAYLTRYLRDNQSLKRLDLSSNIFSAKGAQAIAQYLIQDNPEYPVALSELDLSYNNIGAEGMIAIAEMLPQNTSLEKLFLRNTRIKGDQAMEALINGLQGNQSLIHLDYSHNPLSAQDINKLTTYIENNTTLRELVMHGAPFTIENCKKMSEALIENRSLRFVDLRSMQLHMGDRASCHVHFYNVIAERKDLDLRLFE